MFCVFRSLLIFSFSFICFSCRFLFDFSRSPSQHASLLKCLLYLFISSFCSSSFHLFSFFCLLLCSRFFHLFSLFKLPFFLVFLLPLCSLCQTLCGKNLFKLLRNYFFFFSPQKNFVFSVSFSLWLLLHVFPCLLFFCVLKKWFLVFITRLFLIFFFNSVSLFSLFWCIQKKECVFCREMWEKHSFVFCFCSLGLKTFCVQKNPFYFSTIFEISFKILFSLHEKPQKNSDKKPSFFVFVQSLLLFYFFSQHFLSSLFSWFTFYISFWFFLLFLFSLFFILSLFLHLRVSPYLFFLYLMFPYFCSSSPLLWIFFLFYLIFLLSLLCLISFFFSYFFTFFFIISVSFFARKKFKNFCGQFFYMKSCLCFLNPPFFGVSSLVFSLLASSSFLVCSMFYWLLALLDSTFLDFLLSTFYLGL